MHTQSENPSSPIFDDLRFLPSVPVLITTGRTVAPFASGAEMRSQQFVAGSIFVVSALAVAAVNTATARAAKVE